MRACGRFQPAIILVLWFLLIAGPVTAAEILTILHINDLHGWLLPFRTGQGQPEEGGLARLAAMVAKERTPTTLFLAGGDLTQGTNLSNLFRGRPVIEALNLMRLDATAVGNHEFDNGLEAFRENAALAGFPFLAANIRGADFLTPWKVVRVGTLRVGLFGLTTEETPVATHPRNVTGLTFTSPVEAAGEAVAKLQPQADIIVCVSHLGAEEEEKLAATVPGIAAIIGGHTHTKMDTPVIVGRTAVAQAFERGAYLGRLDLTVEAGKVMGVRGRLIPIRAESGEDPAVAALVRDYALRLDEKLNETVGRAGLDFDGAKEHVRSGETNLGDLVADVMRLAAGSDAALINGGTIRASIPAGPVTVGAIYNALPFDSYLLSFALSGQQLREAIETGVSRVEFDDGGFPQVSGIAFAFDPAAPAGSRVRDVKVGGQLLDESRIYTLATNDFLAAGGNNYTVFAGKEPIFNDSGRFLRDVLADYWRQKGTLALVPDGRIAKAR